MQPIDTKGHNRMLYLSNWTKIMFLMFSKQMHQATAIFFCWCKCEIAGINDVYEFKGIQTIN